MLTREQKEAFSFCFRFRDAYLEQKENKAQMVEALLLPYKTPAYNGLDFAQFSELVRRNIERYAENENGFMSCEEIKNFFTL